MSFVQIISITALLVLVSASASPSEEMPEQVGPTKIRFYTGNLSVETFIHSEGGNPPSPNNLATPDYCRRMKSVSVSAACDYPVWRLLEPEPGKWDWSLHDQNEHILHEHGLQYNVFCWLHFPPKWFMESSEYIPYRCVEHDQPIQQLSLWAPATLRVYDRFYGELAKHFGDKIDFIRLATPAEYGEIGYPNGMTNWIVRQEHHHSGFWCNDRKARADFRLRVKARYTTLARLNEAWSTDFRSWGSLEYPEFTKDRSKLKSPLEMTPQERLRILDFIDWYYGAQERFVRSAVEVVRRHFPDKEIIVSMGYGSQRTMFGNDDVGIAKLCSELRIACQTPGNIPYFCMKSLASPCRVYDVRYFTEPPGNVDRNAQVNRIWADASCGTQTFFDYPQNLLGAKDILAKYKDYLDGSEAIVEIAVFFPTTDHRLRDQDWPAETMAAATALREYLDYDLVDERMIGDGMLGRYPLLMMCNGNIIEESTMEALDQWIRDGGVLVMKPFGRIETVQGKEWEHSPDSVPAESRRLERLSGIQYPVKRHGKGTIIIAEDAGDEEFARLIASLAHDPPPEFAWARSLTRVDDAADGITATLFEDRIIYLNPTDMPIRKVVSLRESDFPTDGPTGRPDAWEYVLHIAPHSIEHIELHRRKR